MDSDKNFTRYFEHPFTMVISGPTGCKKTTWLTKLIINSGKVSAPPPKRIFYIYSIYQPDVFDHLKSLGVVFVRGLPSNFNDILGDRENPNNQAPAWVILDDVMTESIDSQQVVDLFTKGSHHLNLSVILLIQNLFVSGKNKARAQSILKNSHYNVLFSNPRDKTIVRLFASQFALKKADQDKFMDYFNTITNSGDVSEKDAERYKNLSPADQKVMVPKFVPPQPMILDFKITTPDRYRIISNVFGENTKFSNNLLIYEM